METREIIRAIQAPQQLQRAAKAAFAVGSKVALSATQDALLVKFAESDNYYFSPDDSTMHALELVDQARRLGFVVLVFNPDDPADPWCETRSHLVVRIVFSTQDVRVQIGASRWYVGSSKNTEVSLRTAIVDAFCAYYDAEIAPKPAP